MVAQASHLAGLKQPKQQKKRQNCVMPKAAKNEARSANELKGLPA